MLFGGPESAPHHFASLVLRRVRDKNHSSLRASSGSMIGMPSRIG
jgi:hypothetical protein